MDRGRIAGRWAAQSWQWSPLLIAAAYGAVLLLTLSSVVGGVYAIADVSSAPYLGQLLPHAPRSATVLLGNISWAEALWFELLTRWVPDHHELWELAPWVSGLLAIGAVAWATAIVADRWAGMIVAVVAGCGGAALLPLQFAWNTHALAYTNTCLLGAFLVWLTHREHRWNHRRAWLAVALAGLAAGAGYASDPLFGLAGLGPFTLAGVGCGWLTGPRRGRPIVLATIVVVAVAGISAAVIDRAMRNEHLLASLFPVRFAPYDQLLDHTGLLLQSLIVLLNGDFGGAAISGSGLLALACAAATLAGCWFVARTGVRLVHSSTVGRTPGTGTPRTGTPGTRTPSPLAPARDAFVTYWTASALLVSGAFVLSTVPHAIADKRYLVTVVYAVAVLVATGAGRRPWARALTCAGAIVIVLGSTSAIAHRDIQNTNYTGFPDSAEAAQLAGWLMGEHLRIGYAPYWDAAPLTWDMNDGIDIYPVDGCDQDRVCEAGRPRILSWYTPRRRVRTFFVVDSRLIATDFALGIDGPQPSLGRPLLAHRVDQFAVYVYPDDIAARFAGS